MSSELPPGFVLDPPPSAAPRSYGSALPAGFVLDDPPAPSLDAADQQFRDMPDNPMLRDAMADEAARRRQGDGLFMNTTAGINEGIYGTLGAPVDLATGAINLASRGVNALTGSQIPAIENPVGGSRFIAKAFGAAGVPDPEMVRANSAGERVARGAGQGVGYMLAPELAVRGVAQAAGRTVNPYVEAVLSGSRSVGDLAGNAVAGAAAGGGAAFAGDVASDSVRPLAEFGGGLAGGLVGSVVAGAPRMVAEGARMAGDYLAPLTASGQERMAATALRDAASDPVAARAALEQPGQIVPGSQPTTFQQSGDMGLGALERATAARAPEQFMQRRAEQNAARRSALDSMQPLGQPEAVVGALRQNLAELDRLTGEAVETATATARGRANAIGGTGTPEGFGATIRQQLVDAETGVRARERALWDAVDPDGSLALEAGDIRQAAVETFKTLPKAAKPMEGEERAIFQVAAGFQGVKPFKEVTALRSRVSTAMREELWQRGRTPVYARLSQLRGAIERQIENAVEGKAAQEAEAVASGAMRQEDTMAAIIQGWTANWRAERAQSDVGGSLAEGAGGDVSGRASAFSPALGAGRARGGRFEQATRREGVQGSDGLLPNFDEAAQARLRAATEATRQRAQTFDRGPVGDVLRRSGSEGPFNTPNSVVPSRFFRPGERGYEDVMAVRNAVGTPENIATVRDYALSTLRKSAEREDGTIDPQKLRSWRERHKDALRAFPEINSITKGAEQASEEMARLAVQRKQQLDDYRKGLVGRLIDVQDPADITRMVGAVFNTEKPVLTMRRLAAETSKNPEAYQGLRKTVADWISGRFISNTEAGTSGQSLMRSDAFQQFLRQNEPALRIVFKPGEISAMKAIAADLQRANRSVTAVKLPGGSNTAQDLAAIARNNAQPSRLQRILSAIGSAAAGAAATGGAWGAVAGLIGSEGVMALRKAGLESVDDLITDAMLNPRRAALLLEKAPPKPSKKDAISFADRFRRAAAASAATDAGGSSDVSG